ncbi:MAG TPA: hypothetical protein LFW21_05130, partial [Rickettsia endosymbiont of Pyrocoelia pectoralis]|nr:hypothetical protein [Rickettsia endosymbiont of Pyrocoelia pectoralis]
MHGSKNALGVIPWRRCCVDTRVVIARNEGRCCVDQFLRCHPVDKPALLHGSEELEELEESKKRVIVRKERKKERK